MSKLVFTCPIVQKSFPDGSPYYAPDLTEVVHPTTGAAPIGWSAPIESAPDGTPLHDTVELVAEFSD